MISGSTIYILNTIKFSKLLLNNVVRHQKFLIQNSKRNSSKFLNFKSLKEIFPAKKCHNGKKILLGMSFFSPSIFSSEVQKESFPISFVKIPVKSRHQFNDINYLMKILYLVYESFRICLRALRLSLTFAPILIFYPVSYFGSGPEDLWWKLFVKAIELSGPICIKFGQWASTRRDLFSDGCCLHLSRLQRRTQPHSWYYTKIRLAKTFGKNWRKIFVKFDNNSEPVGSGCVAQVYKVWMNPDAIEDKDILEEINVDQEDDDESTILNLSDGLEILSFDWWKSDHSVEADEEKATDVWHQSRSLIEETYSSIYKVTRDLARELVSTDSIVTNDSEDANPSTLSNPEGMSILVDDPSEENSVEQHALVEQWEHEEPSSLEKFLPSTMEKQQDTDELVAVAIKVLHPGVYGQFRRDLAFLKFGAVLVDFLFPPLQWISLPKCVDEFSKIMSAQIDLRVEANNLEKFSDHFADVNYVKFPKPLRPYVGRSVLVETYEEGEPMLNFITNEKSDDVKKNLAQYGVDMLLKMIFEDNFVHADLHPGNILVQNVYDDEGADGNQSKVMMVDVGCDVFVMNIQSDPKPMRICILDCGIVAALKAVDLNNLKAVFTQVVLGDGRSVANLFLENSENNCRDPEQFRLDMSNLVDESRKNLVSLGQVDVGLLLQQLLSLLMNHQIRLEAAMSSVVVSVFILEGLGRSLDSEMDILQRARPLLVTGM